MSWKVKYYPKETDKFLKFLDKQDFLRVGQEFDTLVLYGFSQLNDSLKKMVGMKGVWELKVKQCRIFLMQTDLETIQILGTILKKSNKTPLETIELIRKRAKLFGGA